MIIDTQLHAPSVSLSWADADERTRNTALTEALLDNLDAVGVDRVLLFPRPPELGWAESVAPQLPDRVGLVVQATGWDRADTADRVARVAESPHHRGLRLVLGVPRTGEAVARYEAGEFDVLLGACERHGVPLFLMATWRLGLVADLAKRFPDLPVVLDHFGLPQPPTQEPDTPRLAALGEVLDLARCSNVSIKVSGGPALSVQGFPYRDLWGPLREIADAWGADRMMWGSDISRFDGRIGFRRDPVPDEYPEKHTYAEALTYLRVCPELDEAEKSAILGGTAQRLLDWT